MAYVTVDVDIDEFNDNDLIDELEKRGYTVIEDSDEVDEDEITVASSKIRMPSIYIISRDFTRQQLREHLEHITGCGGYQTNEEVLNKLKELLS